MSAGFRVTGEDDPVVSNGVGFAGARFQKGAYALGKVVWGKGWEELLKLLEFCQANGGPVLPIDCYGDGEARTKVS